ncbi:hypothetical protein EIP91_005586 [Steccherinum ochraceum]|uniref:DUF6535 domain-containing protein n=1 Tax=Steccherinum ochraceum TaxID=92696 RepID=A0A4R0RM72_9APHY|nr:hypothetical protein EIP91_005586 [Steccherinum ochraceum]
MDVSLASRIPPDDLAERGGQPPVGHYEEDPQASDSKEAVDTKRDSGEISETSSTSGSWFDLELLRGELPDPAVRPDVTKDKDGDGRASAGASKIWTMYNEKAKLQDDALVARILASMNSLLIFAGLFSAVVSAFIIESYQLLKPDPNNLNALYLAQLTREIVLLSGRESLPSPPQVLASSANENAVAVNILWVLSLITSLTCALGATLVQSWMTRYQEFISEPPDDVTRGRCRARYFDGFTQYHMEGFSTSLPAILHVSLFLFLAGLVVFLFPINRQVAHTAMGCAIGWCVIYGALVIFHMLVPRSLYHTPLTRFALAVISWVVIAFVISVLTLLCVILMTFDVINWTVTTARAVAAGKLNPFGQHITVASLEFVKIVGFIGRNTTSSGAMMLRDEYLHTFRNAGLERRMKDDEVDSKALRWLVVHCGNPTEIQDFLEGVEILVENHPPYATAVLKIPELGLLLRRHLESCARPDPRSIERSQRHHRMAATARIFSSIFTHARARAGAEPNFSKQTRTSNLGLASLFLHESKWLSVITGLRDHEDRTLALYSACFFSLLVHWSMTSIAFQMKTNKLAIDAPGDWSVDRMLVFAVDDYDAVQWHLDQPDVVLVTLLLSNFPFLSYPNTLPKSFRGPLGPPKVAYKLTHISATGETSPTLIPHVDIRCANDVETTKPVLPETVENEGTLLTLSKFLDQIPLTDITTDEAEVLARVGSVITKDGSAKHTHSQLRRNLIHAIQRCTKFEAEVPVHDEDVSNTPSPSPASVAPLFQLKELVDDLVAIVESIIEEPGCSTDVYDLWVAKDVEDAQDVLTHLQKTILLMSEATSSPNTEPGDAPAGPRSEKERSIRGDS